MKVTGVKETGIGILYHKDNGDDYYSHVHNCVYIVKYWMCLCFLYLECVYMYIYIHIHINMCM